MRWEARTGLIWIMIGTGGEYLWMRQWNFWSCNMWGISCLAEELLVPQEGLCSMQLDHFFFAAHIMLFNFLYPVYVYLATFICASFSCALFFPLNLFTSSFLCLHFTLPFIYSEGSLLLVRSFNFTYALRCEETYPERLKYTDKNCHFIWLSSRP